MTASDVFLQRDTRAHRNAEGLLVAGSQVVDPTNRVMAEHGRAF
ncbi:hypothetical protein J3A74_006555 [Rhodococcus sp. PvP104]|nr:hypothetical protein [Rhodococcus sp. PvP104]